MSTIVSTWLQDRASGKRISTEMNVEGTAKAWAVWDGMTMAVSRTFNITSINDSAVGAWTPIFIAPFDGPFTGLGSAHYGGSFWAYVSPASHGGGSLPITAYNVSVPATAVDANHVSAAAIGRLA